MSSIFLSTDYKNRMQSFIVDAISDKQEVESTYKRLFLVNPNFKILGKQGFIAKVNNTIKEILRWKAGIALFRQILGSSQRLVIASGMKFKSTSLKEGDKVTYRIILGDDIKHYFYCSLNEQAKRILVKYEQVFKIALIHEAIHVLHFMGGFCKTGPLLSPEMDDLEEQITISGIDSSSEPYQYNDLCENLFLALMHKPFRIQHGGLCVEIQESLSICDYFWFDAEIDTGKLKDINIPQKLHVISQHAYLKNVKILPLSAAICMGRKNLFLEILKIVDLAAEDDIGGPLHAAVMFDQPFFFTKLVELGLDINKRDAYSNTPLIKTIKFTTTTLSQCFDLLIKDGKVDLTAKDSFGRTALDLASSDQKYIPKYIEELQNRLSPKKSDIAEDPDGCLVDIYPSELIVDWVN